mgnify:CR=1 FL=1
MSYHKERRGKEEHEQALRDYISNCKNKIIDLAGKSPDAIEAYVENGEIKLRAVEVLPIRWSSGQKVWKNTFSHIQKIDSYRRFDDVRIITYRLEYSKTD